MTWPFSPYAGADQAMPWCETCSAYREPAAEGRGSVSLDCGHEIERGDAPNDPDIVGSSAPWHFWVMVAMLAAYLLWRLVQAVFWLV